MELQGKDNDLELDNCAVDSKSQGNFVLALKMPGQPLLHGIAIREITDSLQPTFLVMMLIISLHEYRILYGNFPI
jgi:hypothetical protein